MKDRARFVFTASVEGKEVTEELLGDVLNDEHFSAVRDFARVTFVKRGMAPPRTPRLVFGIEVDNDAFGSDIIDGANRTALELLHAIRAQGVDVTPHAVVWQSNKGFERNDGLDTNFDDPERKFYTYDSPATELTLRG